MYLAFLGTFLYSVHMSVRMKLTHSKTGSRRAHHRVGKATLVKSGTSARVRHHVDLSTGMYRGKQILAKDKPSAKKATGAASGAKKGKVTDKKETASKEAKTA